MAAKSGQSLTAALKAPSRGTSYKVACLYPTANTFLSVLSQPVQWEMAGTWPGVRECQCLASQDCAEATLGSITQRPLY